MNKPMEAMKQYGGMIPFSKLKNIFHKQKKTYKKKNKNINKKKTKKKKSKKYTKINYNINNIYKPDNYSIGTIIRYKNKLWMLKKDKTWNRIKV